MVLRYVPQIKMRTLRKSFRDNIIFERECVQKGPKHITSRRTEKEIHLCLSRIAQEILHRKQFKHQEGSGCVHY
jgi:hypothetical protein